MNDTLLKVLNHITARYGAEVLGDPRRLKLLASGKVSLVFYFFQFQFLASHLKKLFHGKGRPHPFGNTPQIFKRGITAGNRLGALRGGKRKNCPARRYFTGNLNNQPVVCRYINHLFNNHKESIA